MKTFLPLILFVAMIAPIFSNAQQWVDQKYTYDSLLNVTYGSSIDFLGNPESHTMDIYLPDCDDSLHISRRPLAIFIHGGAFIAGDKDEANIQSMCKQFAKRGYVTASINYRLGFISDEGTHTCNFPNYSCVFATDSAEWARAYYRGVQDAKGALRYLINRNVQFRIDTNNVFVAGESAGSFVALGVALMDVPSEKLPQANATSSVGAPNPNTSSCVYNVGKTFPASISRPDLGDIYGTIEPSSIDYTIKGVGNFYGGMMSDLLQSSNPAKPKPSIYSFHQPCDMVVPIDSAKIYAGLTWCMNNGYNCYGISNTPKVYGSRGFSGMNTANSYGYTIQNNFTATNFPYSFLIGTGSCADQVNNPCHAYDNFGLRLTQLANYFAPMVSTSPICDTAQVTSGLSQLEFEKDLKLFPNPASESFTIRQLTFHNANYSIQDNQGRTIQTGEIKIGDNLISISENIPSGLYFVTVYKNDMKVVKTINFRKN
jgi:alpha/beta superfamily hydrolase